MPRTILCQKCGVVLNLPTNIVAGKRMKCPGCGHRFVLTDRDASSASTIPGVADAATASTHDLVKRPPSHDDLPIPVAEGDLRETFDLPLLTGSSKESGGGSTAPVMSDAEALFHEKPVKKKRAVGAEARAQARRCVSCGGIVPKGMSICVACGVDQETGLRVGLEDDLAPPPPPPSTGPPLHISITGMMCGLTSVILVVFALIQSVRGEAGVEQYGWICLSLVSAFGVYGTVQFLRGRSVKMLMVALTLGVFVDIMALIALPIIQANFEEKERVVSQIQIRHDTPDASDIEDMEIKPIAERIDQQKIVLGVGIILVYALLSIYLMSPPVKRYFHRQAMLSSLPF